MTGLLMVGMTVAACGEEPAPPPPPPPPPPAAPDPAEALVDLDPGVQFPEEALPNTLEAAEAIVAFANTFRAGDRDAVSSMLGPDTKQNLMLLPERVWVQEFEDIEAVRVCIVEDLGSNLVRLGMGIQEPDGAYLLGWEASFADDKWVWEAIAIGNAESEQVSMLDAAILPPAEAVDSGPGVQTSGSADDEAEDDDDDNNGGGRSTGSSSRQRG